MSADAECLDIVSAPEIGGSASSGGARDVEGSAWSVLAVWQGEQSVLSGIPRHLCLLCCPVNHLGCSVEADCALLARGR